MQPEMTVSSSAIQDSFGCNSSLLLRHGFSLWSELIFILSIVKASWGSGYLMKKNEWAWT